MHAVKRERDEARARAAAAEGELSGLRRRHEAMAAEVAEDCTARLAAARAAAEERVERHTEKYRAQVRGVFGQRGLFGLLGTLCTLLEQRNMPICLDADSWRWAVHDGVHLDPS